MNRILAPEILDGLAPDDPDSIQSRRDLKRINAIMRNAALLRRLHEPAGTAPPQRIADLGSGDGVLISNFLTAVRKSGNISRGQVFLIDRHLVLSPDTKKKIESLGWEPIPLREDLWKAIDVLPHCDLWIANLFLHHFSNEALRDLFLSAARRCENFLACEPERSRGGLLACRFLGLLGCNVTTRHDAAVSVRAGFHGRELSKIWNIAGWELHESRAGLFSHVFRARRQKN
jgi:hypothetical protein